MKKNFQIKMKKLRKIIDKTFLSIDELFALNATSMLDQTNTSTYERKFCNNCQINCDSLAYQKNQRVMPSSLRKSFEASRQHWFRKNFLSVAGFYIKCTIQMQSINAQVFLKHTRGTRKKKDGIEKYLIYILKKVLVSWSREVSSKKLARVSISWNWGWRENCSH